MKTLAIELPDPLAAALDHAVVDGGFRDAGEVAREALRDYLSHRRFALQERHQTKDIAAALAEAKLQQPQESGKLVMEDGFAVLVAPPGAPEMTPELVKALRDDLP